MRSLPPLPPLLPALLLLLLLVPLVAAHDDDDDDDDYSEASSLGDHPLFPTHHLPYADFVRLDHDGRDVLVGAYSYNTHVSDMDKHFIFFELLTSDVISSLNELHIDVYIVKCDELEYGKICEDSEICLYRKGKNIFHIDLSQVQNTDDFVTQTLIGTLQGKVGDISSRHPMDFTELRRQRRDLLLMYFSAGSENTDIKVISRIAHHCKDLPVFRYITDSSYFHELFAVTPNAPTLVKVQCQHYDCVPVHLTSDLTLESAVQFLKDVDQDFIITDPEAITDYLRSGDTRHHTVDIVYDVHSTDHSTDHSDTVIPAILAVLSEHRHHVRVLIYDSLKYKNTMNYKFPFAKFIDNEQKYVHLLQGEQLTADNVAYQIELIIPPIMNNYDVNIEGYNEIFGHHASEKDMTSTMSKFSGPVRDRAHIADKSFVFLYYKHEAASILAASAIPTSKLTVHSVNCFDDIEICESLHDDPSPYPVLVYYDTNVTIKYSGIWQIEFVSKFINSVRTLHAPLKSMNPMEDGIKIFLNEGNKIIHLPGIAAELELFVRDKHNSEQFNKFSIAADTSAIVVLHNLTTSVCTLQDSQCVYTSSEGTDFMEFSIQSMRYLYSLRSPIVIYFSERRLTSPQDVHSYEKKLSTNRYPSCWVDINTTLGKRLKNFYYRKNSENYPISLLHRENGVIYNYPYPSFVREKYLSWIENIEATIPTRRLENMKWTAYGKACSNMKAKETKMKEEEDEATKSLAVKVNSKGREPMNSEHDEL